MKSIFLKTMAVLVLVILLLAAVIYYRYEQFLQTPVFSAEETRLEIQPGNYYSQLINQIKNKNGAGAQWQWQLLGRWHGYQSQIKSGEYAFSNHDTPRSLLDAIAANRVISYSWTIVEGQTWQQIQQQLSQLNLQKRLLADKTEAQIIEMLSIDAPAMEGQLLPETYQYTAQDSDLVLLKRAHKSLQRVLQESWVNRQSELALQTPYEMLIMASIIEKETAVASERNIISGVFNRRLKKNMRLQTDPTVIYGVGDAYAGDITYKHLRTDTPYNTYTRHGLPPTPIAMAGADSIYAAGQPNQGNELFFVASGDGGHVFSETYVQHQQAVNNYLKRHHDN
ncbi:endolytic transglycosylase MltG [Marinicella gelatinilytica]|uniref:endolytic transglycosylase MltG n=1 Tax=Marinicella gelatinilytica TaxID=2996017 RepID=UPI002260DFA7|nr:endolytic transglycosylase MltG [Marinicella gelatinilytica]MCX7544635.1 endolytic transglycosylase MltG [Marinicella gelatinilytica]